MNAYASVQSLVDDLKSIADIRGAELHISNETALRHEKMDRLVYSAVFGDDEVKPAARWIIWQAGQALDVLPASIHEFYMAGGQNAWDHQTTPAINVRGMAYNTARAVVRTALKHDARQFIFEIARSEIGYAGQRPEEYATVMIAAALREGYRGTLFIQGDHFQFNAKNYGKDSDKETKSVKDLTLEALKAGFYNIDIDSSTLVDLSFETVPEQQRLNYQHCAELTGFIRQHQPSGVTVSVGGEIGEVGKKNSTVEELKAFMDGYLQTLRSIGTTLEPISKISVQTGTSHGGVVLPDGSIAQVSVDFDTLGKLSEVARADYKIGGAVQHGASTLPETAFNRFAEANACEVHLATGFQNIIYDSQHFPKELLDEIYAYLAANHADERKPGMTDAQFYYTTRKRAFGPFKQQLWDLPDENQQAIGQELQEKFDLIFSKLNVTNSSEVVAKYVHPTRQDKPMPESLKAVAVS